MEYPKISIITPVLNGVNYLEETIKSVIDQQYPNLEYIIIDGGSIDGSIEIIKKYENKLTYWISEKDNGLYDAIQKGLEKSSGIIMGWINADDMLHRKSLFALAQIFTNNKVDWVQGYPTIYNTNGITKISDSHIYSKYQLYSGNFISGDFIQQESTFWRRTLWEKSGSYISNDYRFAGDFELWIRFFRHTHLYSSNTLLGGYRISSKQLSRLNYNEYILECSEIISKEYLNYVEKKKIKQIKILKIIQNKLPFFKPIFSVILQRLYGEKRWVNIDFINFIDDYC